MAKELTKKERLKRQQQAEANRVKNIENQYKNTFQGEEFDFYNLYNEIQNKTAQYDRETQAVKNQEAVAQAEARKQKRIEDEKVQHKISEQQSVIDKIKKGEVDIDALHTEALAMNEAVDLNLNKLGGTLEYSTDEKLNTFVNKALSEGNSYEEINARINAGFRGKGNPENKLTEEQYGMAKRMIKNNESTIREINSNYSSEVVEQATKKAAGEAAEGISDVGNPYLKQVFSGRNLGALLNLGFAVSDYNEARNAGDGVVKSAVKAGAQFVAGEALGMWMMPVMLAKQVPTIAISAIETTQNVTRKMNSVSRIQTFGEAQFQDTQQLATMRQAGMELAKMSQYNLQQSIMGNEAQYMHKL